MGVDDVGYDLDHLISLTYGKRGDAIISNSHVVGPPIIPRIKYKYSR